MYLKPTARRKNANLIRCINFENDRYMNIAKLHKPYKGGGAYIVYENTESPFCSNGIFKTYEEAREKLDIMRSGYSKNNRIVSEVFL